MAASDAEVEQVLEMIREASVGVITEETKVSWDDLRNYAQRFLDAYDSIEQNQDLYKQSMMKQMVLGDPSKVPYYNKIAENQLAFLTRSKYLLAIQFDEYLNNYRGGLPSEVLYIQTSKDGKINGSYKMNIREFILNADKHGRIGDISKARLEAEGRQSVEEDSELIPSEHVEEARMAYEGTTNRLQRFFEVTKKTGNSAQAGIVMWKENQDWILGRVTNKGDIKEAYAGFLLSEHINELCKMAGGNAPYYSHPFIGGFYDEYITNVTNLSAIVEEDIVTKNEQFSIKGRKSQLPSIGQYLRAAEWIVSQQEFLTPEEVDKGIRKNFDQDVARNFRMTVDQAQELYGNEFLDKLEKTLSK